MPRYSSQRRCRPAPEAGRSDAARAHGGAAIETPNFLPRIYSHGCQFWFSTGMKLKQAGRYRSRREGCQISLSDLVLFAEGVLIVLRREKSFCLFRGDPARLGRQVVWRTAA